MRKQVFKQVSFHPNYNNRHKRKSKTFLPFLLGLVIGAGAYWFIQTNYFPRANTSDINQLKQTIETLKQEKDVLSSQISQSQNEISNLKMQITANAEKVPNPIKPVEENINGSTIANANLQNLSEDNTNSVIGVRKAEFSGYLGKLKAVLVLSEKDKAITDRPIKIYISTFGKYKNGNNGFEELKPIEAHSKELTEVQQSFDLTKRTLTPNTVEIKIIDSTTKSEITKRKFDVQQIEPPATDSNSQLHTN